MKALRAIFGVVFIVVVFYGTWKLVPPYFYNYQLQDTIADEARMNTYTSKSEEDMRETIWRKAQDLDIPITRDEIKVQREGQTVAISVDYTVHIDFPVYPLDLQFHSTSKNKAY